MEQNKLYIETYGCQMNISDSEIVAAILKEWGYSLVNSVDQAGTILLNTCSVREHAENRIWSRLDYLKRKKKKEKNLVVGVIGCMAERIGEKFLNHETVSLVAGPDAYRDLPYLLEKAKEGEKAVNILLSEIETYDKITPVNIGNNTLSGYISIMRGCNNFCTYCIVPYTRGRERSRNPQDILKEVENLSEKGYKEVTLLGQNVNSYKWQPEGERRPIKFKDLISIVAEIDPNMRIRFTTSHPKDLSDHLLQTIEKYPNVCNHIHLPMQSGSSKILKSMNRKYDSEWYKNRIEAIRKIITDCGITTDVFAGFCGETEDDHKQTLELMKWAQFDMSFMFKYSERPGTYAQKKLKDDVPEEIKTRRLNEIIQLQNKISLQSNKNDIGKTFEVLVEGVSKKSDKMYFGRTSQNKVVVFPRENHKFGDYIYVKIKNCTQTTLIGS